MELRVGYKQTEIGIFPEDWDYCLLDENSKRGSGHTPNKKIKEFYEGDIVWVSLADSNKLDNGKINSSTITISKKGIDNSSAVLHPKGIVLMSRDAGVGKSAIADCELCVSQHFITWLCNEKTLHNWYLYYWLQYRKSEFERIAIGSTIKTIGLPYFKQYRLTLPKYIEQTAIAIALSDTDALISSLEKLLTKKRNIKQGAMQKLLQPNEGWANKFLPDVCWFQEGPGVRNSQFTTSGVKLFNGTNIEDGKLLLEKTTRYISEKEAFGWYSHFLVDDGDILIACSGVTIDKFQEKVTIASLIHLPLCMNTSTMRFKITSNTLSKDFFFHFLKSKSFKEQIGGKATGSAQLNFGPSHVKMVEISLPSLSEQTNIATILSDMDAEIATLETKLEKYRNIKLGMMQELLTGKIRLI